MGFSLLFFLIGQENLCCPLHQSDREPKTSDRIGSLSFDPASASFSFRQLLVIFFCVMMSRFDFTEVHLKQSVLICSIVSLLSRWVPITRIPLAIT